MVYKTVLNGLFALNCFLDGTSQEFSPWWKWIIFDALLALIVGWLANRFEGLRPFFEAVGWL